MQDTYVDQKNNDKDWELMYLNLPKDKECSFLTLNT